MRWILLQSSAQSCSAGGNGGDAQATAHPALQSQLADSAGGGGGDAQATAHPKFQSQPAELSAQATALTIAESAVKGSCGSDELGSETPPDEATEWWGEQ